MSSFWAKTSWQRNISRIASMMPMPVPPKHHWADSEWGLSLKCGWVNLKHCSRSPAGEHWGTHRRHDGHYIAKFG
jgi:hypothetical protein